MESLAVADIDLNALAHNVKCLKKIAADARLMAVVKADGYGHGAVPVARTALENGAESLAVARLSEAIDLRNSGIDAPILLFGYSSPETLETLAHYRIDCAINDFQSAKALSDAALRSGTKATVHLKVDTGMGRLGPVAVPDQQNPPRQESPIERPAQQIRSLTNKILNVATMSGLEIEGIFTHFANADSPDKEHAEGQFSIFMDLCNELKKNGLEVKIKHAANSAATIEMPQTHLDMVRPGIALYGLWPSDTTDRSLIDLKPVMTLRSKVIGLKSVPAGFSVSYGSTYRTSGPTDIATVALGYADGLNRLLSSRGSLLIGGKRCPIIGRVCMDLVMADVTHAPDVALEDEVIAIGQQKNEQITAEEIASLVGTINYEVVTSICSRVQRVYKK